MGLIDLSKWKFIDNSRPTMVMRSYPDQLQCYSDDEVYIEDGKMTIRAQHRQMNGYDYTSGWIMSNRTFKYGRFETRIKVPMVTGVGAAIWLLPDDNSWVSELDIFEVGTNRMYGTVHYFIGDEHATDWFMTEFDGEWHDVVMEWSPNWIQWIVDGTPKWGTHRNVPQIEMYMILNMSIGDPGRGVPDPSLFPHYMYIDYFRYCPICGYS